MAALAYAHDMLTRAQEKLILSLHTKKGRTKANRCLVEGGKVLETAGDAVDYTFTAHDTDRFEELVTTETPQQIAGVARIPEWSHDDIATRETIVVLDGVQDPGNVGSILRLCLGFDAALLLVESADVTSPKVVRSSVGALFQVPWQRVARADVDALIAALERPVFRLEKTLSAQPIAAFQSSERRILVAGSEGNGITLPIKGQSVYIQHNAQLESLNVGHAIAIALGNSGGHKSIDPTDF